MGEAHVRESQSGVDHSKEQHRSKMNIEPGSVANIGREGELYTHDTEMTFPMYIAPNVRRRLAVAILKEVCLRSSLSTSMQLESEDGKGREERRREG